MCSIWYKSTYTTDGFWPPRTSNACLYGVFFVLHHGGLPMLPLRRYQPHADPSAARTSTSDLSAHNPRPDSPGTVDCLSVSCLTYHSFFRFRHKLIKYRLRLRRAQRRSPTPLPTDDESVPYMCFVVGWMVGVEWATGAESATSNLRHRK